MGLFPEEDLHTLYFSRANQDEDFGTHSFHPFKLEDLSWPSVEHYFQALKFEDKNYQEKIRQASSPKKARRLGRSRFNKVRKDWNKVKTTVMTRAIYTKCKTFPEIGAALLASGDIKLVENSQYDYFWGCGRDRRGENQYGQVLMRVREKLKSELKE